jgi:hypothetical protein
LQSAEATNEEVDAKEIEHSVPAIHRSNHRIQPNHKTSVQIQEENRQLGINALLGHYPKLAER